MVPADVPPALSRLPHDQVPGEAPERVRTLVELESTGGRPRAVRDDRVWSRNKLYPVFPRVLHVALARIRRVASSY